MHVWMLSLKYMAKARATLFSIGGVFIGVGVIVVVMSIINGYIETFESFIKGTNAELVVFHRKGRRLKNYSHLRKAILKVEGVAACSGYAESPALLSLGGKRTGTLLVKGIDPIHESEVGRFAEQLDGDTEPRELFGDKSNPYRIVVGSKLLGGGAVSVGDAITVNFAVSDPANQTNVFTVVDTFTSGFHALDSKVCFVPLETLQAILETPDSVSQINVSVRDKDKKAILAVVHRLAEALPDTIGVRYWRDLPLYATKLKATYNDRKLLFGIAIFVVAISGFVVMARLILTVVNKTRDIGILGAVGCPARSIVAVFMLDGLIIGIAGAGLGIAAGKLFAANIMPIASFIESTFQITVFSPRIYQFERIPISLSTGWTAAIAGIAIAWSFLFSVIPAVVAAIKKPVEALRYE